MPITKQEILDNIEDVKKYLKEIEAESKEKTDIAIKSISGSILFHSTKPTIVEAIREANLRGVDISFANFSGVNLSGANLSGANLYGADLNGANLSGAILSGVNFREANLRGVDFTGADLSFANFIGANLSGVNFYEANLHDAELSQALFYGRGGKIKLTKEQVPVFLAALGFVIEE